MKPLGKDAQLTAQSHIELVNMLASDARGLAARGVRFFDRKPKGFHLLNGLVLWFDGLDDEAKAEMGRALLRRLEGFVRGEADEDSAAPGDGAATPAKSGHGVGNDPVRPRSPRRRIGNE